MARVAFCTRRFRLEQNAQNNDYQSETHTVFTRFLRRVYCIVASKTSRKSHIERSFCVRRPRFRRSIVVLVRRRTCCWMCDVIVFRVDGRRGNSAPTVPSPSNARRPADLITAENMFSNILFFKRIVIRQNGRKRPPKCRKSASRPGDGLWRTICSRDGR